MTFWKKLHSEAQGTAAAVAAAETAVSGIVLSRSDTESEPCLPRVANKLEAVRHERSSDSCYPLY